MANFSQTELHRKDFIVLKNSLSGEIESVVFPNGIQVGVGAQNFNKGIKMPSAEPPSDTSARLYAVTGALFYDGTRVGTGAGGGASPGGGRNAVQTNDGSGGFSGGNLSYDSGADRLNGTSGSFTVMNVGGTDGNTAMTVTDNFSSPTFEVSLTAGQGGGEILKYGTGSTAAGYLYYLHTDGTWTQSNANARDSGAYQMLAIALGSTPTTNGMLVKGYVRLDSSAVGGTAVIGYPVYVSTTAAEFTFTAPSGTNDIVRIVGYCLDIHSGDILLYFNPDPTWVEIS